MSTIVQPSSNQRKLGKTAARKLQAFITYVLLYSGAVLILTPFIWMISTSLKSKADIFIFPPQWIPNPVQWENYITAFTAFPFPLYTWNSTIIVVFVLLGTLLSCSFSAYGFARLYAPGKNFLFMLLIATMMLPGAVTMVPLFILFNKLNWLDTFLPLIVPAWFGSAFYIFLMRQFYMGIPRDLEESARIDGCNTYSTWLRIMVPLTKPVLATVAVFTFMAAWNDFMGPLIYLTSEEKRTLALGLSYFQGSARSSPDTHLLMAATLYAVTPCLIIFFFAQKIFVKGIVFTGIK